MTSKDLGVALVALIGIGWMWQHQKAAAAPALPMSAPRNVTNDPYFGMPVEARDTNNAPRVSFEMLRNLAWLGGDGREATPNPRRVWGVPGGIGTSLDYPLSGPGSRSGF